MKILQFLERKTKSRNKRFGGGSCYAKYGPSLNMVHWFIAGTIFGAGVVTHHAHPPNFTTEMSLATDT